MYQTKLTKMQLTYNLSYQLRNNPKEPIEEIIARVLTANEENLEKASKTLDND